VAAQRRRVPGIAAVAIPALLSAFIYCSCHTIAVAHHREKKPSGRPTGKKLVTVHCLHCHSGSPDAIFPRLTRTSPPLFTPREKMTALGREYLTSIIRDGGHKVGRSRFMPRWKEVFNDEEVDRIVSYLLGEEDGPPASSK